ncbi:inositol monophosphatase [Longimonas halophila]|uniref:Inositol-1-monophosphatase n=1 Tax=Longimonas halophila TaxID=1469170 RepID=A0A2H3NKG4_9BACT|nr:inositol monophosphatase family protein [Longimonas halophila]PEN06281.1 inositol monophosphatase [Longimonas halophila]
MSHASASSASLEAWHARYIAESAARAGAAVIRDRVDKAHTVETKGTNDFVTEADKAAQDAIVQVLRRSFPNDTILAEEQDDAVGSIADVSGRRWIIDPIDGTTNFMHGIPPYAVSIALQQDDAIVAAVVFNVPHDRLYAAVKGGGATCNGEPLAVNNADTLPEAVIATGFPYQRVAHTEVFLDVLGALLPKARGIRRHGAASIDLVRVAEGAYGAYYETGLKPWDVAAGALIVREAGGRVTTVGGSGGLHPLFDAQTVATNGRLHETMQDALAPLQHIHA